VESEILHTLEQIRAELYVIGAAVWIAVVFWIIRQSSSVAANFKHAWRETWSSRASALFDDGKYNDLLKLCEEKLKERPRDALAHWWLARAYREKGERDLARQHFKAVVEISPGWKLHYVDPFLENQSSASLEPTVASSAQVPSEAPPAPRN
jgi:tetratricopeptide (TPR) repeat protein